MRRIFARSLLFLLCLLATGPAAADEAAAWAALRAGGHVALMRHALAPGGGDPPGFRLDDCATQRNLSAEGRADAAAVGAGLRTAGIRIDKVLSSPWCRCVDTARLMDVGAVEIAPTFANAYVLRDRREELTAGARALIEGWEGPGNLLVVTHGANIHLLTGGGNPASGEIVVLSTDDDGSIREVGRIPVPAR